jgi:hypothetical protein
MADFPLNTSSTEPLTAPRRDREDPAWDYGNPFEGSQDAERVSKNIGNVIDVSDGSNEPH